jgi:hypothetical protein
MHTGSRILPIVVMAATTFAFAEETAPRRPMSFFVTSVGVPGGANLGGLAGADAHCRKLGTTVGAGDRSWRAYLSTAPAAGEPGVNARDRIGGGPWVNARGVEIA